jgi:hypothetical protein
MNRVHPDLSVTLLIACGVLVGAFGCSDSKSSSIVDTSEIYPAFVATADGSGSTEVIATLRTQDPLIFTTVNKTVELVSGDSLIATYIEPITLFEVDEKMIEQTSGSKTSYVATFPNDEKDSVLEIAFNRKGSQVSAPDSTVTLPTPFDFDWVEDPLTMTPAPVNFSRSSATPYFVTWDPFDAPDFEPGDEFRYSVSGSCIETYRGIITWQNGEDVLQLTGVLQDRPAPNDGMSCLL